MKTGDIEIVSSKRQCDEMIIEADPLDGVVNMLMLKG